MKRNKIIVKMILSISIIFAGLILMLNGKREIKYGNINLSTYNANEILQFVSSTLYYKNKNGNIEFGVPQFFYNKDNPESDKRQVYCIERGGRLDYPSVPFQLLKPVTDGGTTYEPDGVIVTQVGDNRYRVKNVEKNVWWPYKHNGDLVELDDQYSSRYRSHVYTYDSTQLDKFSDLTGVAKQTEGVVGAHIEENEDTQQVKIGAKISYIASYQPKHKWTREKQLAIWLSELGNMSLDGTANEGNDIFDAANYTDEIIRDGVRILAEAVQYQKFYEDDYNKEENNLLKDQTNTENISIESFIENNKEYYLIGPYNLKYLGKYRANGTCVSGSFMNKLNENNTFDECFIINKEIIFGGFTDIYLEVKKAGNSEYIPIKDIQYTTDKVHSKNFDFYHPTDANGNAINEYVQGSLVYNGDGTYTEGDNLPIYPESEEDFYIKVEASKLAGAENVKLVSEYKWVDMDMDKGIVRLNGTGMSIFASNNKWGFKISNEENDKFDIEFSVMGMNNKPPIPEKHIQDLVVIEAERILKSKKISNEFTINNSQEKLEISGYVWDDGKDGKESLADGIFNQSADSTNKDRALQNIKVTLYYSDGKMVPISDMKPEADTSVFYSINPTITDKNGYYKFEGLNKDKEYYVEYEYNGQKYLPTIHKQYGNIAEEENSKAAELDNNRNVLDTRFQEIKASPKSYKSKNNLGFGIENNITFTNMELMGYSIDYIEEIGRYGYVQDGIQLIDGYLYNQDGTMSTEYKEGEISKKIKEYITLNKQYPDIKNIYSSIAGNNAELKKKVQFIEDCKIVATSAKYQKGAFVKNTYNKNNASENKIEHVNLGLWERQQFDLHLWKDVEEVQIKVNGKQENYNYKGVEEFKHDTAKDGNVYEKLVNSKYKNPYQKKLYSADFNYLTGNKPERTSGGNEKIQIRYRIEIFNESQSVMGQVTEVVDYYLNNLTYVDNSLSAYLVKLNSDPEALTINKGNTIYQGTEEAMGDYNRLYISGFKDARNKDVKLQSGESIYIYLTLEADLATWNGDNIKQNIAEINGFKTYYKNNTELPNGVKKSSSDIAGLIDCDSLPGNLNENHLRGDHYVVNLQDDTDMAHGTHFTEGNEDRKIDGVVWEDKRIKNSPVGDGIRQDGETKIKGVKVSLINADTGKVAKYLKKGTDEWKDAITWTNENGYSFEGYLPGNYYVKFEYGDSDKTVLTNDSNNETNTLLGAKGENIKSYNGQDYKSTIFQKDISPEYNVADMKYDYAKLDNAKVSDAIDDFARRDGVNGVNDYSDIQQNHIAEVLNSPTKVPKYPSAEDYTKNEVRSLINELTENTKMRARTPIIEAEIEYNTKAIAGNQGGTYTIPSIDFGLVERPLAQLEVTKQVSNVKITLSDGTILFDATGPTTNVAWVKDKFVLLSMDKELMYGSSIQITYKIVVKNTGETDYKGDKFYAKGIIDNDAKIVKTSAEEVICYVPNNLLFNKEITENNKWSSIKLEGIFINGSEEEIQNIINENELPEDRVNRRLKEVVEAHDTIILTEGFKKELAPGESKEINLVLSKLISQDLNNNSETDKSQELTYVSVVEIVKTMNDVGRRMKKSVVGNQYPDLGPQDSLAEVDAGKGETVYVLPPTGTSKVFYYTLTGAVIAIIAIGIILIKKKIIKK